MHWHIEMFWDKPSLYKRDGFHLHQDRTGLLVHNITKQLLN